MPKTIEQNGLSILEAKEALLEEMEENPRWPAVSVVRQLGIAYLGPNPTTIEHASVNWSHVQGFGPWDRFLRRTVSQVSRIDVEGEAIDIHLNTTTDHKKRLLMPGVAALGNLAFKPEAIYGPMERLRVWTPEGVPMLEVSPGSEMQTLEMADLLLSLPDEPQRFSVGFHTS